MFLESWLLECHYVTHSNARFFPDRVLSGEYKAALHVREKLIEIHLTKQVVLNDDLLVGLPQIVSGIQLLILLTMCLYYLFREWQKKRKSPKHLLGPDPEGNVEEEPLLVNA